MNSGDWKAWYWEQVVQARDTLLARTVHTMVGIVVRWADRYWASLVFRPDPLLREREWSGAIPETDQES
jgi:hypothetical protein